jgi:prepilin-type N-terminal cleavage/methylation domain-containing protein
MYKQLKNDGFTLVEIIVSIAIGSAVLAVVLSVIVTSFHYFADASDAAIKRKSLDSVVSYVRSEILNASELVLSIDKPEGDGWRCLYTEDNMLNCGKAGQEKNVFGASFYKKNAGAEPYKLTLTLEISKGSTSNNTNSILGKIRYKYTTEGTLTRVDTIKFENLKDDNFKFLKEGKLVNLTDQNKPEKPFSLNSGSSDLKLYYKKPASPDNSNNNNNPVDDGLTHTVADKIYSISDYTNRGYYAESWGDGVSFSYDSNLTSNYHEGTNNYQNFRINNSYRIGDCVYYKGYWWMFALAQSANPLYNPPGGSAGCWQQLDEYFHKGCIYHVGDVVKDPTTQKYYQCIKSEDNIKGNDLTNTYYWKDKGTKYNGDGYDKQYTTLSDYNLKEVRSLQVPDNSPARFRKQLSEDTQPYTIKYDLPADHTFDSNKINGFDTDNYEVGSYIQVKVKNSEGPTNKPYYRLYKKIFNPLKNINDNLKFPGNSVLSGWELCENNYAVGSSYHQGDVMRICDENIRMNIGKNVDYSSLDEYVKLTFDYSKEACKLDGTRSYSGQAYYNKRVYYNGHFDYILDMPENLGSFESVVASWSYYASKNDSYQNIASRFFPEFDNDNNGYYFKVTNFRFDDGNINYDPFSNITLNLNYIDSGVNNGTYYSDFRDATWTKTSYKQLQSSKTEV